MSTRNAKRVSASLDHQGEFDEMFLANASVHIERMGDRAFWIGIAAKGFPMVHVDTGVHRGKWFFNVFEDVLNDAGSWSVIRPAHYGKKREAKRKAGK